MITTLNDYQKEASLTDTYPKGNFNIGYKALGLTGEAGEVADKIKKIYRDKNGIFSVSDVDEIEKELGDCLWYLSQIAKCLDISLSTVATTNINKLRDRQSRNKIHGEGDNR